MMTIEKQQKMAKLFYDAYGTLCLSVEEAENFNETDLALLSACRNFMFEHYKRYDPENSFDVSLSREEVFNG
jgi:hypothetical protein